jgi:amino acid adenylation domain-containing protein
MTSLSHLSYLSLAELAAFCGRSQNSLFPKADRQMPELSWAQERLWFMNQLTPNNPFYNLPFCFEITGPLHRDTLQEALNHIIVRHEPLRSVFPPNSGIKQHIKSHVFLPIPYEDLRYRAQEERQKRRDEVLQREATTPFDLTEGPLLRACLLQLDADVHHFIYSFHHIVFDGWSNDLFFKELTHLYEKIQSGEKPTLSPVERYSDFALWQRQQGGSKAHQDQLTRLKEHIGHVPPLQLPTDYTRPALQSFKGQTYVSYWDREVRDAVERYAQEHAVTPFMIMLAAFQVAMGRYGEMNSFLMGSPSAGRVHPATHNMIGFFLNNLILVGDIRGDISFHTLVQNVRESVLEASEHQNYSFQDLVQSLGGARDLSRNPLYQISFCYQMPPLVDHKMDALIWRPIPLEQSITHMDLEMMAWPDPQGICVCTLFATDLFRKERIEALHAIFKHVLLSGLKTPHIALRHMSLASQEVCETWSRVTGPPPVTGQDLWGVIQGHSRVCPEAIILIEENGEEISWADLMQDADDYARMIYGQCPEWSPVALRLHPSRAYVACILAALRLGRPWIPLDPRRPEEAISEMLDDISPGCLMTTQALWPNRLWSGVTLVVDDYRQYSGTESLPSYCIPHDDACVFIQFTSGSSGRPKAVEISHGGMRNRLTWALSTAPLSQGDRGCLKTSPAFVDAACELLDALAAGLSLVLPSPDTARSPYDLAYVIQRHRVTRLVLTPSFADAVFRAPQACFTTLKILVLGGENVSKDLATRLLACLPHDVYLLNYYGATELTSDAAYHRITREDLKDPSPYIPIGHPLPGTELWLLDDEGHLVAPGMVGNLHASGRHLALGYRNQPDRTAKAYHQWESPSGEKIRLYNTGDRATRRCDGAIICLGRRDRQIKIRGIRIESGEIESRLRAHPDVAEAVLVLHEEEGEHPRLVAHLAKKTPESLGDLGVIRTYLGRFFSSSVVPEFIVVHEHLPMTATGKVDRKRLPQPPSIMPVRPTASGMPMTELEKKVHALWEETLRVQGLGLHDSFFDSGGNSLLLAQLHHRLLETLPYTFPLTDLFQYPTIAALTAHLEETTPAPQTACVAQQRAQARQQALRQRRIVASALS